MTRRDLLELGALAMAGAAIPIQFASAAGTSPDTRTGEGISPEMLKLSNYISEAGGRELPQEVVEKAKQHILDSFAAMISGADLPPGRAALRFIEAYGGKEVSTVIGSKDLCGPIEAALANGMLAHADETDDSHGLSHSHLGCAVVPASLAAGEQFGVDGTRFLRAVTLGYDVGARVTMALGGERYENESHRSTHSIAPIFGTTAAAACLAGMSPHQARLALGYTVQQCSGLTSWRRDEEHVQKAFVFAGMTARNGVSSVLLVHAGWTGVEDLLSGADSFFQAFDPQADPAALVDQLGQRYEITRADIKKWTVGSPIQAALDAMVALLNKRPFNADQVQQVTVHLAPPEAITVNNRDMPDISLQHMIAVMLLDKTVTFRSAHDKARMKDPAVLRQKAKVKLMPDPQLSRFLPTRAAIVEITLNDGTHLSEEVDAVRGTSKNPMSRDEVVAKARDLMTPVLGADRCSNLINLILQVENIKDVRQLRPLLQRA